MGVLRMQRDIAIIDIDNVISHTFMEGLNNLREKDGLPPILEEPTEYEFGNFSQEDREYCFAAIDRAELYTLSTPYSNAVFTLQRLGLYYDIVYMTSRGRSLGKFIYGSAIDKATLSWLYKYELPLRELH